MTEVVLVGEGPGVNEDRLGRPFVGRAGELLVRLLASIGWRREDVFITNIVKCRPPDNRDPRPEEIAACRRFLTEEIAAMPRLRALLCLGRVAHDSVVRLLGEKLKALPFAHGAVHSLERRGVALYDSYHCSRYNTNTGVLTPDMFDAVFVRIRAELRSL